MLGKRGSRLFIGGADPTDQEAVERIKFATQLAPEWVIVEHDKLSKILEGTTASVTETLETLASGDFEFDVTDDVTNHRRKPQSRLPTSKTRRSCASCRRC